MSEIVSLPHIIESGKPPVRPEAEHERAYQVWAVDGARDLRKTAEITDVPYATLWRWHRAEHWQDRWEREWGELTEPARRAAAAIVAMRADAIMSTVVSVALDPGHPQWVQASKLALDHLNNPVDLDNVGGSGVRVQILNQFNSMTEDEMRKAVASTLADNMDQHQQQRTRKASS